jgi:DNA-binding CsgD family transcriptional regulator
MNFISVFYYAFALAVSVLVVATAFRMYQQYRLKYLAYYTGYLLAHYILGFFGLLAFSLTESVMPIPPEAQSQVMILIGFLIYPFVPMMLYMFVSTEREILNKGLPARFVKTFILIWAGLIILYIGGIIQYYNTNDDLLLRIIWGGTFSIVGICFFLTSVDLLIRSRSLPDTLEQKAVQIFALMYFVVFSLYGLIFASMLLSYRLSHLLTFLLHFSFNIPPLFYLRRHLKMNFVAPLSFSPDDTNLSDFFDMFSITKREAEVIGLILEGKRAKDIEQELFISYHTVKNHIHNIYRKLGVKNRMQILGLIQSHLRERKEEPGEPAS